MRLAERSYGPTEQTTTPLRDGLVLQGKVLNRGYQVYLRRPFKVALTSITQMVVRLSIEDVLQPGNRAGSFAGPWEGFTERHRPRKVFGGSRGLPTLRRVSRAMGRARGKGREARDSVVGSRDGEKSGRCRYLLQRQRGGMKGLKSGGDTVGSLF